MKRQVLLALAIALICVGAGAQQPVPAPVPPDIPMAPGCTLVTDVNLTDNDILGMAKQAIQGFAESSAGATGDVGKFIKAADPAILADAIAGVKVIRFSQFKLPADAPADRILGFYSEQFTADQGWSRVLYDVSMIPKGGVEIFTKSGQEFFGAGVVPKDGRLFAFRTVGSVDVAKLAQWLGGVAKFGSEMEAKKPVAKPVVKKPAVKKSTKKVIKKK